MTTDALHDNDEPTAITVPAESALARSERELAEAMASHFEAFRQQGVILHRICSDKEYLDAGFKTFKAYMNERMPIGVKYVQAKQLIAAMQTRKNLPQMDSPAVNSEPTLWTERAIRPLTQKAFEPSDQKRLGKMILTRVKNGEKLTAALVKEICDEERGVPPKKAAELSATPTAAEVIRDIEIKVELWQSSLGNVPMESWDDAEADDPGCWQRASQALADLASFCNGQHEPIQAVSA